MALTTTEELEIKRLVRLRDGHKCVECGMTNDDHIRIYGKSLQVHRIIPGSVYSVRGCETVCYRCHSKKPKSKRRLNHSPKIILELPEHHKRAVRLYAAKRGLSVNDVVRDLIAKFLVEEMADIERFMVSYPPKD